jgi:protein SCO1/2
VISLPKPRRRTVIWFAAGACVLLAAGVCALVPRKPVPQPIASILKEVGFDQRLGEDVPLDLSFRDERGSDVKLATCFGSRPVVLSFVYYQCPMLCTQVLEGLVHSLRSMNLEPGKDFELVTVSIDARDTSDLAAKKKQSYLAEYGNEAAEPAWHFLTSPAKAAPTSAREAATGEAAARLAEAVGFRYHYDESIAQFAHASGIVVLTGGGQVSKYFYGIDYSPRDLRLALVEASQGEIGSWLDQALLLCYHYDPMTGAYGLVILTVIRVISILTVILIAALLVTLLRRERRALPLQAGGP